MLLSPFHLKRIYFVATCSSCSVLRMKTKTKTIIIIHTRPCFTKKNDACGFKSKASFYVHLKDWCTWVQRCRVFLPRLLFHVPSFDSSSGLSQRSCVMFILVLDVVETQKGKWKNFPIVHFHSTNVPTSSSKRWKEKCHRHSGRLISVNSKTRVNVG